MMSVHCEKNTKGKEGFIDRLGWDPRRLQHLFLSDADKSCCWSRNKGESSRAIHPKNVQKHVQLLVQLNISADRGPVCLVK